MDTFLKEYKCSKTYYNEKLRLAKVVWNGIPDFEEYISPFTDLITHAESHFIENFLSDTTNQGIISTDSRKWFEMHMVPLAKKKGLKRVAIVIANNPFKRYYANMLLMVLNKFDMPMKVFSDTESAEKWIASFYIDETVYHKP